jgi:quercetin dioxygenase-like cupin family protein
MKIKRIEEMKDGWFVGDFEPTMFKTKDFEVCYKVHEKDEEWDKHYHTGTEINYLIRGKMILNDEELNEGDIFLIEPYEVVEPTFLEKCELIVVKTPSNVNDKFIVKDDE